MIKGEGIKGQEFDSSRRCGWDVTVQNSCPDNQDTIWQCLADLKKTVHKISNIIVPKTTRQKSLWRLVDVAGYVKKVTNSEDKNMC